MFQDFINQMQKRTWPYGTRKTVLIAEVETLPGYGLFVLAIDGDEGHILLGGGHDIKPEKARTAVMRFENGGPTRGYWKLIEFVDIKG